MRQFVSNKNPENGILVVVGKDFRYLRLVLRLSVGDMFSVRLPDGSLRNTTVSKIDDAEKRIVLQVCDSISLGADFANEKNLPAESLKEIWLFMFVPSLQNSSRLSARRLSAESRGLFLSLRNFRRRARRR